MPNKDCTGKRSPNEENRQAENEQIHYCNEQGLRLTSHARGWRAERVIGSASSVCDPLSARISSPTRALTAKSTLLESGEARDGIP